MTTIQLLQARFPHLFGKGISASTFYRGWATPITSACESIDALLDCRRRRAFHWRELREVKGKLQIDYWLAGRCRYIEDIFDQEGRPAIAALTIPGNPLVDQIDEIVDVARRRIATSCMVCGREATTIRYEGRHVTVCASHTPSRINMPPETGLTGFEREALEWDSRCGPTSS